MKTLIITPARYSSTRFPGKPLAKLGGREIILRVVDRITEAGYQCLVATDDERIRRRVEHEGYSAIMTSINHNSGTDRVREAVETLEKLTGEVYDIVINVQGDEPFIDINQLRLLEKCFEDPSVDIATLARPFPTDGAFKELNNPNLVKLVKSPTGSALYFSRSVIPYLRGADQNQWPSQHQYFTHIGVYAYRTEVLRKITELPQSPLEKAESLEQLRWLENGYSIKVAESRSENIGIDTPEDLEAAEEYLKAQNRVKNNV
ncbi:MAG: 3-deoxy-manno-octulosonate cytidylyltransferase [Muribaculaceae bacterium]|nr:3-deoxy-manno-octulosonate cytidylyltransferase [Muribaculaceae bacterium]